MNQATNFGGLNLEKSNQLWRYVASMEPEAVARLSQPASEEVLQVMEQHVGALLGHLPASHFDVSVTTSREGLGQLLAAAMMNGYFLRAVEQRMGFEQALQARDGDREAS
jgi:DNA-binding GntR family transcriptional regulator